MTAYWLMYFPPAMFALSTNIKKDKANMFRWLLIATVFSLIIGFRYQVGGDWYTYLP